MADLNLNSGAISRQMSPVDLSELEIAPDSPDGENGDAALRDPADRRLIIFRRIAAPLMAAIAGWSYSSDEEKPRTLAENAAQFAALIDSTVDINREIVARLSLDNARPEMRWMAAGATAEIIAAHFRATTHLLTVGEAEPIIEALQTAVSETLGHLSVPAVDEDEADAKSGGLARTLRALAPAASSIARFSFGRDAYELLQDVTRRLTSLSVDIAARLNGSGVTDPLRSPLYHSVLEVAGEFYMESHFAEMDRLLAMEPEARREYVREHDRKIPMEPVWEALELRMAMLEAMASYVPREQV